MPVVMSSYESSGELQCVLVTVPTVEVDRKSSWGDNQNYQRDKAESKKHKATEAAQAT